MKKIQLLLLFISFYGFAQNVTILPDGIIPNSTISKLKYSEFNTIQNPQNGDIKFDKTFSQLRFYNGQSWNFLFNSDIPIASVSSSNSTNNSYASGICSDSENSIYVAGSFVDSLIYKTDTIISASTNNIFLLKTNSDNEFIWKNILKSTETVTVNGITIDSLDNIYIYGHFSGSLSYQTYNVTSFGGEDIFILKLNKNGQLLLSRRFGGSADNYLYNLKISPSNTLYFCGSFYGSMPFAAQNRVSSGGSDGYIAEMDTLGNQISFIKIGGSNDENIKDFSFTTNSQLVAGGNFGSNLTIGTSSITPLGSTFSNMFLATLNYSNFIWLWGIRLNTNNSGQTNSIKSIEKGKNGSIYVSGIFSGTFSFDLGSISALPGSAFAGFILQTSGGLNVNWAYKFSGGTAELCEDIKSDIDGNAIVILNGLSPILYSTYFNYSSKGNGDAQILKFSPIGNLIQRKVFASQNEESLNYLHLDAHGRTYFIGSFKNNLSIDNLKLKSVYDKSNVFWGFYDED